VTRKVEVGARLSPGAGVRKLQPDA
jgi:hypothetical protein